MTVPSPPAATMPRTGRPTECTPELLDLLFEVYERTGHLGTACKAAGITRTTFYNWRISQPALRKRFADAQSRKLGRNRRVVNEP